MSTTEVMYDEENYKPSRPMDWFQVHVYGWCLFFSLNWMILASTPTMIICSTVASIFNIIFLGQELEYLPGKAKR